MPSLLLGVGSGVLEVLLAVLLMVGLAGAMKLIVRVVLTVFAKVIAGKVTIPVVVL